MKQSLITAVLIVLLIPVGLGLMYVGVPFRAAFVSAMCLMVGPFMAGYVLIDLDGFMANPRLNPLLDKLGRTGCRLLYITLGFFLVALAIWLISQYIDLPAFGR
jgi:hypothetical protein